MSITKNLPGRPEKYRHFQKECAAKEKKKKEQGTEDSDAIEPESEESESDNEIEIDMEQMMERMLDPPNVQKNVEPTDKSDVNVQNIHTAADESTAEKDITLVHQEVQQTEAHESTHEEIDIQLVNQESDQLVITTESNDKQEDRKPVKNEHQSSDQDNIVKVKMEGSNMQKSANVVAAKLLTNA